MDKTVIQPLGKWKPSRILWQRACGFLKLLYHIFITACLYIKVYIYWPMQ